MTLVMKQEETTVDDSDSVKVFPDKDKYKSLNISHCVLSSYDARTDPNSHHHHSNSNSNSSGMMMSDDDTFTWNHTSTEWRVTVIQTSPSPLMIQSTGAPTSHVSYNDQNQLVFTYPKEQQVQNLLSDLHAADKMAFIANQLLLITSSASSVSHMIQIKYLTHAIILLKYGPNFEYDTWIEYDTNGYKVSFYPALQEIPSFVEYQLNELHPDSVRRFLTILQLVCVPLLEMKKILFQNHRRIVWTIIPRSLVSFRLFYTSPKYEYSLLFTKQGLLQIREILADGASYNPLKMDLPVTSIVGWEDFKNGIHQLNRYATSMELFGTILSDQFQSQIQGGKKDLTNLSFTFGVRGTTYCIYMKEQQELAFSIEQNQQHNFTDEEAKFLSEVLFKEYVLEAIIRDGIQSPLPFSPLTAFQSLIIKISSTAVLKNILQTLMNNQKHSIASNSDVFIMEDILPTSAATKIPTLYVKLLYFVPLEGVKFPKVIEHSHQLELAGYPCVMSSKDELFLVLRFFEKSPSSDTPDFVDLPILMNSANTSTPISFQIVDKINKAKIPPIGTQLVRTFTLGMENNENPLGHIVHQLCCMTLDELNNMEM